MDPCARRTAQPGQQHPGQQRHGAQAPWPQARPAGQNQPGGGIYTAPMDHSYRAAQGNNGNSNQQNRGAAPGRTSASSSCRRSGAAGRGLRRSPTRIFAFVDDLFFLAKIQETARKMNVKVEFVKTEKDLNERMGENGDEKPSLIIFDLNNVGRQAAHRHSQAEGEAEEGDQHHRLRVARAGRAEDEGAGSRLRYGGAALGILAEPGANPAPPRRS